MKKGLPKKKGLPQEERLPKKKGLPKEERFSEKKGFPQDKKKIKRYAERIKNKR